MMEKSERIAVIEQQADGAIFFVKKSGQYWTKNNLGYTEDVNDAKIFRKAEIIHRLKNNGLIGKEIVLCEQKTIIS